jgi:GTP1/Obg family GTP-binding protein
MSLNKEVRLRTVEQICSKTDQLLEQAHELDVLAKQSNLPEIAMEINKLTSLIEALQWARYMSQELN